MSDILTYDPARPMDALTKSEKMGLADKSRPADAATVEHYREQAKRMFGDTMLPAVIYKGTCHVARLL